MSADDNKLLVRRYYEEVVNTGNVDAMAEFISPEFVEVHYSTRYPVGLAGAREHVLGDCETDLSRSPLTVEQQIAEDEWVATCLTARSTHNGVWLGMRPAGEKLEMTAVNIDRVVDGHIVEYGAAANLLEPFLKIGAIQITDPADG